MRRSLKKLLPDVQQLQQTHPWLKPFSTTLLHPHLWHINRRSVARAVAIGLFCGLIPGPLQMLGSLFACVVLHANLPIAILTTLYTNPFTIIPLYVLAYAIGRRVTHDIGTPIDAPDLGELPFTEWGSAIADWVTAVGEPLLAGLLLMGAGLAAAGYVTVRAIWRWHLIRRWQQRHPANSA